ncbi:MAG: nucleotidyl transferase AbiEii/AbiGii toxin family protein [Nanoarchaeota archaeon]
MENTTDLRAEISRLNAVTKFSPWGLEKDYHLTRILHKISEKKIENLVFKGGTCLNKCYLGFYRLSEDLDFVFNQDVKDLSKLQIKKILDNLRRIIFEILNELNLEVNKELGKGWKMLTSIEGPKIIGLEIITQYPSLLDDSQQKIKIDISFRKRLINSTKIRPIHHEFINALGEPLLKEDVEIEAIDLSENFAEKFRALVTRKNIAVRDVYDIYFILKEKILKIDKDIIELSLIKIRESLGLEFTKEELRDFIVGLHSKLSNLNEKEIQAVLKSEEKIDINKMIDLIITTFLTTFTEISKK